MAREAYHEWCSFRLAKNRGNTTTANESTQAQIITWKKPPTGYIKCNIDAALFHEDCSYGIDICVRDSSGNFVKAETIVHQGNPSVHEAEAMGLLAAIDGLLELQHTKIILELDCNCKHVVDCFNSRDSNLTEFGSICKNKLCSFQNHVVGFTRRQANHVTHILARASRLFASHHVYSYLY